MSAGQPAARPGRGPQAPSPTPREGAPGAGTTGPADADGSELEPLLYTVEEAAALLQVRPSWLRRKAAARAVPCTFLGKHLRFSRADLDAVITDSAHQPPLPRQPAAAIPVSRRPTGRPG